MYKHTAKYIFRIFNQKFNDKRRKKCYHNSVRQTKPIFEKGDQAMKTMTTAIFYIECEQEAISTSEYSFIECAHLKISGFGSG